MESLIDRDVSVEAFDIDGRGVKIPIVAFCNIAPLGCCAVKLDSRKANAIIEGIVADIRNVVWNRYAHKVLAMREGMYCNSRNAAWNCYVRKALAIGEGAPADACQLTIFANGDGEARAMSEGGIANGRNTIGNRDGRKACATLKSRIADARQFAVFTKGEGRKARASLEGIFIDARDVVGNRDGNKTRVPIEGFVTNYCYAVRNRYAPKIFTLLKGTSIYARDTVGNFDTRKCATIKGIRGNGRNLVSVNGSGDDNFCVEARTFSGNGTRFAI